MTPSTLGDWLVMAPREPSARTCMNDVTAYLIYLVLIATIGPLQYGFHLVIATCHYPDLVILLIPIGRVERPAGSDHLREEARL